MAWVGSGEVATRHRLLLISSVLAVLLGLAELTVSCGSGNTPSAPRSAAPSPSAAPPPPVAGSESIDDPYFPLEGNGGYVATGYDIQVRYDPSTDRIQGHTTITARASKSLGTATLAIVPSPRRVVPHPSF